MKKPDGVVVIAVYYALVGLVFLLASCALVFGMAAVLANVSEPTAVAWSGFGIGIGLLFCLVFLIGSIVAAWGLLALKNWGRWAAIILAILQLPAFPIWTIIGGLIIYYLLREDVRVAFNGHRTIAVAAAMPEPFSAPPEPATIDMLPPSVEPTQEGAVEDTTGLPPQA